MAETRRRDWKERQGEETGSGWRRDRKEIQGGETGRGWRRDWKERQGGEAGRGEGRKAGGRKNILLQFDGQLILIKADTLLLLPPAGGGERQEAAVTTSGGETRTNQYRPVKTCRDRQGPVQTSTNQ